MVRPALRRASGYSIGPAQAGPNPSVGPVDMPEPRQQAGFVDGEGTRSIKLNDGSIVIEILGQGSQHEPSPIGEGFDENLAEEMDEGELSRLAMDILDGIRADDQSRAGLLAQYTKGLDLLALATDEEKNGRQRKRTSTVRNPVMLDAVVKFWASAQAELLPASGPCKVRDDAQSTEQRDQLAADFERDMNHYLTVTAKEFYPDTAQMLMMLGFGGTAYKKVYRCPLRERPVSESVRLPDLIISEQATDLDNAIRVTHQIMMAPTHLRRLQVVGFYRDVELGMPVPTNDPTRQKEASLTGLSLTQTRPQDMDRTLYECYTDVDLADYGVLEKGAPKNLPLPYRVTIDKDAMRILEVRRNWKEGDKRFCKRQRFVKYQMVPGFGFLGLGFLHLLGNQTKALTALWRIMIDSAMFGAFPGGVRIKGTRQTTNEIAPGPGEWVEIDTGPATDIKAALMPLPYKDLQPTILNLVEMISGRAEKLSMSIEFPAGEGRTNIPVGTIMAMIEQQTQTMAAVHKGLHRAQQEELIAIRDLFAEDPEALWKHSPDPSRQWSSPEEFMDKKLVPATDPNVPSQIHRIMIATAMVSIAKDNPDIYDRIAVHRRAWSTIGVRDVDTILQPPAPAGAPPPDPDAMAKMAEVQLRQQELALKKDEGERKAAAATVEAQQRGTELNQKQQMQTADRASKERLAQTEQETERMRLEHQVKSDTADRDQKAVQHAQGLAVQQQTHQTRLDHEHRQSGLDRQHKAAESLAGLDADRQGAAQEQARARGGEVERMTHERGLAAAEHAQARDSDIRNMLHEHVSEQQRREHERGLEVLRLAHEREKAAADRQQASEDRKAQAKAQAKTAAKKPATKPKKKKE